MRCAGCLRDAASGQILIARLDVADSFWKRFLGWMGRTNLSSSDGLWLTPCRSIHTMWMCRTIDVIFLSREQRVLKVCRAVRPWCVRSAPQGTESVIEVLTGACCVEEGMHVVIERDNR